MDKNPAKVSDTVSKADGGADKEKESSNKLLSAVGVIACIILIPILLLNLFLIVQSFSTDDDKVPNIGGYFPLMVQSGSMSGCIEVGDLIICRTADGSESFNCEDVITFWDGEPGTTLVTHRIVEVTEDENGELVYITKGDANNALDAAYVYPENIVGIYNTRIPYLGNVALFMQTVPGLVVCVLLPLALFVIYDAVRRRRIDKKAKQETAALLEELERLKKETAAASANDKSK